MTDLKLEKIFVSPQTPCIYWIRGEDLPCSDVLIARAAEIWCGEKGKTPFRAEVLRPEFGKPRFAHEPNVHFSISHSGSCWICAIGDQPVGIDLQFRQKVNASGIARRHFHPLEALWLETHPDDFFKIWTAKEAFVKYTGKGIDNDFGAFSVVDEQGFRLEIDGAYLRFIPFFSDYVLAAVTSG